METYRKELDEVKAELRMVKERGASRQKELSVLESNAKSAKSTHDRLQKKTESMERDCMIHRSQLQAAQAERDDLELKLRQARADLGHGFFHDIDETREMRV